MSETESFNEALKDFRKAVVRIVFKYEPIQISYLQLEITKKGKLDKIIFKKPQQFISTKKMKFLLMSSDNLLVEDGKFKITGKIRECIFKGDIVSDEIICDVNGRKNKKAIAAYLDTSEELIGLSFY
jgi:hypothetical protein